MATVSNTINMQDKMTPVLRTIIKSMQSTLELMSSVDKVSNKAFDKAKKDVQNAAQALDNFNNKIDETPPKAKAVESAFSGWQAKIIAANQAIELARKGIDKIVQGLTVASAYTDMQSRLRAIIAEHDNIYEVQEKIKKSAMDTRSSYQDTVESVVSMRAALSEYGLSTDAAIRMAELMNKALTLGGTKGAAATSVMYNLQQSLASGRLQWEDWREVSSNSIYLAETVAKNLGVTRTELNELVKEGKVSASDFANALLAAGNRIDTEFNAMPDTFVDWMTNIKTFASGEFMKEGGLHDKILELISHDQFLIMVENIKVGLSGVLDFLGFIVDKAILLNDFIANNWTTIAPIIAGITGATVAWAIAKGILATMAWIANGGLVTLMITTQAFFTTLLANPLTWVILLIGILIYYIYQWVDSLGGLANAWEITKLGILVGWNALKYGFMVGVFAVIGFVDTLIWAWKSAGVSIANFMGNMHSNVLGILQSMVNGAIGIINAFISELNKIPGVSIEAVAEVSFGTTAAIKNRMAQAERNKDLAADARGRAAKGAEREAQLASMKSDLDTSMTTLAKTSAQMKEETKLAKAAKAVDAPLTTNSANDTAYSDLMKNGPGGLGAGGSKNPTGGKLDSVGKIDDDISITDEDIKLLKDIAATQFINKYTTLRPEMSVTFGDVRETADVNQIMDTLEIMVEDALATSLVG